MKTTRHINDVIPLGVLQQIQDNFSKASGLAFITVDYKGRQVTRTSNYSRFCTKGQLKPEFKKLCAQCDAHGGLHAAITGQPNIYYCHANLVDFAVPLILDDSYIGAVLGGQVKLPGSEEDALGYIIPKNDGWREDEELSMHHEKIVTLPLEKIKATVVLLQDMIKNLIESKYKNLLERESRHKGREISEEKARGLERYGAAENERDVINSQFGFESFFSILNLMAKLAYREKASETEEVIYDFSAMMRYALSGSGVATVGEEIDYSECFLRIHKAQKSSKLDYRIVLPEEFAHAACPFMVLKPVLENAVAGLSDQERKINIEALRSSQDLLLVVRDNGEGLPANAIEGILGAAPRKNPGGLARLHSKLISDYGAGYGLIIKSLEDGISGTEVTVRIPLVGNDYFN